MKKPKTPSLPINKAPNFESFNDAFAAFIARNCVPATTTWDPHEPPYISCEIRIALQANGSGYMHLHGQDSETFNFKKL